MVTALSQGRTVDRMQNSSFAQYLQISAQRRDIALYCVFALANESKGAGIERVREKMLGVRCGALCTFIIIIIIAVEAKIVFCVDFVFLLL